LLRSSSGTLTGGERYDNITRVYYAGAVGALVVFDVTRPNARECALIWKNDLDEKIRASTGTPLPTILIGTKIDLLGSDFERVRIENEEFAQANGFLRFFGASARDRINLEESVRFLADYIDRNRIAHEYYERADYGVNIAADEDDDDNTRRSCW
jgi:GTPase SAR1 family protein